MTLNLWDDLSKEWQTCLRLAWEAYRAGSLPIAAVVTDESGAIVAAGRNRIGDAEQAYPRISNHPLAHAEMNALLELDTRHVNLHTCTLYTTTEPCPLCMGAIRMVSIKKFHFASHDPSAGCSGMLEQVPYLKVKNLTCVGPLSTPFENALVALQIETHLRKGSLSAYLNIWRAVVPVGVAVGERLHETGELQRLAREGARAERMLERIESVIDRHEVPV